MNHQRRNILFTLGASLTGFFSSTALSTAGARSPNQLNTQVTVNTANLQKLVHRASIIDAVNIIGMGAFFTRLESLSRCVCRSSSD